MARTVELETRSLELEKLQVNVKRVLDPRIGSYFRDAMWVEAYKQQTLDGMVYEINSYVLAEKLADKHVKREAVFTHNVVYPASWWQHFKKDVLKKTWLTRWFVNWRPILWVSDYKSEVATLEVNLKQYATFPSADLVLTPESIHQRFIVPYEQMHVDYKGPR